ncbi:3(or 17)beta-hydroxysteroid dehydrogenase [Pseudomonas protegens]|uniref:glucose 1-dehydrogenase n=1 Tax=Pseudomonas TaxID=286 RepID=UPI00088B15DB|nr:MULTISPECIES: glucose 1-dehydrogenase [Pseudomonas]MCU1765980.1 glucose 1-dehydrogenase [Pseudomonas protegens]URN86599.1 MAG: glucose 1-dehydrogenase [Pseudomonas protegens]WEK24683.1 MAG: glucose 1-dehydrogenase [Pseudomonas protegens]SDA34852.1 3(or 17)beta-hydroxysteroid dehydrogenase [Pseudomonas sp. NFPP12]SEM67642.1 3(or 17)beta-hydroxysteroid dehydrogenase [Pseudomonas sp. NFPP10]
MQRVEGKVCIVTGAASGVGREDALLLASQGAKVVLTDVNQEAGHQVAAQIGENALFLAHDITREDDWQRVVETTVQHFGRLDVLVNNAAILAMANIEDTSLELWRKVLTVNSDGYFLGCKYAIAAMKHSGGGSIINMSSVAALGGLPLFCAYSASKGAVAALTRSVAVHCKLQGYRIRCNSVHPDGINTPMTQALIGGQSVPQETLDQDPMNRMCAPRDVANAVLFLASDESRFVNGAEILVDNAQLISGIYEPR